MTALTIGLIADTHVPDRKRELDWRVLPIFAAAKVSAILHAGDVSVPRVLDELGRLAPVTAVRGNRDWVALRHLPISCVLEFGPVRVALAHGHLNWRSYAGDKLRFLLRGPRSFDFFAQRVAAEFSDVDVVVFGHNHEPMVRELAGKLVVNPGSACCQVLPERTPSVGLLHIDGGTVRAEIVYL
jgi:putative phosphoesterase